MGDFALPFALSLGTCASTLLGGLFALRWREDLPLVMGFTAGVLLGVVSFDIFPEIVHQVQAQGVDLGRVMVALVGGFLLFHVLEKLIIIHHSEECVHPGHRHPRIGVMSALALIAHSVMDGLSIGLGFRVSRGVGIVVAAAVISHDFVDGMNTVVVMLGNKNTTRRAVSFLAFDALAPVLGLGSAFLIHPSPQALTLYLGFLAGFILYIGASHILPEAHSERSSVWTLLLTVAGAALAYALSAAA